MIPADLIRSAVDQMAMLRYFPSEPTVRVEVAKFLAAICPNEAALRFVVDVMVNRIGEWRGPKILRGIVAARWSPADGIDGDPPEEASVPGLPSAAGSTREQLEGTRRLMLDGKVTPPDPVADLETAGLIAVVAAVSRRVSEPTKEDWDAARAFAKRVGL